MSDIKIIGSNFPIQNPGSVSVRIVFAKENETEVTWHLVDMATGHSTPDGVSFMALHGRRMFPIVKCDTVLQAQIRCGASDLFCYRCLDEFEIAKDIIERRRLMKFS